MSRAAQITELDQPTQEDIVAWICISQFLGGLEILAASETKTSLRRRKIGEAIKALNGLLGYYKGGERYDLIRLGHHAHEAARQALEQAVGEGLLAYCGEVYLAPQRDEKGRAIKNPAALVDAVTAVAGALADGRSPRETDHAAERYADQRGVTARAALALRRALQLAEPLPELKRCETCGEYFERPARCSAKRWQARRFCGSACAGGAER